MTTPHQVPVENPWIPGSLSKIIFVVFAIVSGVVLSGVLVSNSADAAAAGREAAAASQVESESPPQLELRSVVALSGGHLFSLRDPETERTFWIELGETRHGVEALEFEIGLNRLTVRHRNEVRTISLSAAGVTAAKEPDPTRAEHESRIQDLIEMYSERIAVAERWLEEIAQSPDLRDLDERIRAFGSEISRQETTYLQVMRNLRELTSQEVTEEPPQVEELRIEARKGSGLST